MAFSKPGSFELWGSSTAGYRESYGRDGSMPILARAPETEAGYKLCVSNLPMINEDGIRRIFGKYGHVVHVSHNHDATWAYVIYGSYHEAQRAVHSIHRKPPLDLEVTFVMDKELPGTRHLERIPRDVAMHEMTMRSVMKPEEEYTYDDRHMLNSLGGGQQLAITTHRGLQHSPGQKIVQPYENFHYPVIPDPCLHKPYETSEPLKAATNTRHSSRNLVRTTTDGGRQVNMVRNNTWCELPHEHPKVFQQIMRMREMRLVNSLNRGGNVLSEDNKCQYCGQLTMTRCQRCRAFYCGRTCQEADWPSHSIKCQPMPLKSHSSSEENIAPFPQPLRRPKRIREKQFAPDISSTPLLAVPAHIYPSPQTSPKSVDVAEKRISDMKENAQLKKTNENVIPPKGIPINSDPNKASNERPSPSERLNRFKNKNEPNKGDGIARSKSLNRGTGQNRNAWQNRDRGDHRNEQNKNGGQNRRGAGSHGYQYRNQDNRQKKDVAMNNQKAQKPIDGREQEPRIQSKPAHIEDSDHSIGAFPTRAGNTSFLPSNQFIKVKIVVVEAKGIYWVQKEDDQEAFMAMMLRLHNQADSFQKVEPTIGNVYAVRFDGLWHRAILTSSVPKKVLYVDFGNEVALDDDDFRKLAGDNNLPFFAQKICLADGTPEKYRELGLEEVLSIKPIGGATKNGILVQIENVEAVQVHPAFPTTSKATETNQTIEGGTSKRQVDASRVTKDSGERPPPAEKLHVNRTGVHTAQTNGNLDKFPAQNRSKGQNRRNEGFQGSLNKDRNMPKSESPANRQNAQNQSEKQEPKTQPTSRLVEPDYNFKKRTEVAAPAKIKRPSLPNNIFTEVKVVIPLKNGEYWVQRSQDEEVLQTMMLELNRDAVELQKVEPLVGNIYAHRFETIWHRVILTSDSPRIVHYVDFGNDEPPSDGVFRKLKESHNNSFFALKIRLVKGSSEKYKSLTEDVKLSVKPVGKETVDGIVVQVEGDNVPVVAETPSTSQSEKPTPAEFENARNTPLETSKASSEKSSSSERVSMRSVLDSINVGKNGLFQAISSPGGNKVSATVFFDEYLEDFKKILEELPDACNKMPEDSNFTPKIGDLICGKREDDWLRGYVVALGPPLKLAVVDEDQEQSVHQIRPLPEGFDRIPTFGGTCEILSGDLQLKPEMNYVFEVTGSRKVNSQKVFEVIVAEDGNPKTEKNSVGLLKSYCPPLKQKGIPYAQLTSGSEVCITTARSPSILFVRSLATKDLTQFEQTMDDIAKYAKTASPLITPPVVGKMVLAKFSDGNYYRAIVRRIDGDKFTVSYVDFGNAEDTTLKNLKQITGRVKNYPSCATKVYLKDVPRNATSTKETTEFLAKRIDSVTPLVCTFDGTPTTDGVYLKSATGASVNDRVNKLLQPTTNAKVKPDIFMVSDVKVASLGNVGDIVCAIVLYTTQPGFAYMMCPEDSELVQTVEILGAKIQKYCNSTKNHFVPVANELCLALFQDSFYRAMCLEPTASQNTSTVLFIDYGNIEDVAHTDIRRITKDFIGTKALANMCQITGLDLKDERVSARVKQLVTDNKVVLVKIVEKRSDDDNYVVELPEVRDALIKEGLITL